MKTGKTKVAIIGAGYVGAATAFAMTLRGTCDEIVLIDVAFEKAEGEANDIRHGLCFLDEMNIYAGTYEDVADCDVIVMSAGVGRKPGETRLELAKKNVAIAKGITTEIMKHYNGGVILVVANPVDVLTYKIAEWTGLPKGRVIGSGTSLDTARYRSALSDILDVDVRNIHGYIMGEHGDSQVPAWSATYVAVVRLSDYCKQKNIDLSDEIKAEILEKVKTGGAQIIKRKGATYYGIAVCTTILVDSLIHNKGTIRPVSTVLDGEYGISGVAISLPAEIGSNGAVRVLTPELAPEELELVKQSAEACKAVLAQCEA